MARICIRIVANDHPTDPTLTPLRTRLGDVVFIVEDSHVFSAAELNCGQYRFIQVIGVTAAELLNLVESIFDANGNMTKRRVLTLDSVVLKDVFVGVTTVTKAQLDAITKTRT